MRKVILTIVTACAFSVTTIAQEVKQEAGNGRKFDKTEIIQRRTDRVAKRYSLNESQAKQLLQLNTAYADKMPMRGFRQGGPRRMMNQNGQQTTDGQTGATTQQQNQHPTKEQIQARRREMQANMESYNNELKKIMTPDQFTQYTNDLKNQRARGPRGPRNREGQTTSTENN